MHWRRYGYINDHSPADHDGSTDSRYWTGQVYCQYESSLETGYAIIRVTVSPIRSRSTVSTPIPVWSLFLSGGGGGGSNCTNHQLSYRWKLNVVMRPHRTRYLDLTGRLRVGRNATSASARAGERHFIFRSLCSEGMKNSAWMVRTYCNA
jgi:hypothetical protein